MHTVYKTVSKALVEDDGMGEYDSAWVAEYFDQLAEGEWERLTRSPVERIKLEVHAHYLREYVQPGWRVLEVGAGAGRFTQVLSEIGAQITVTDVSEVQLNLNREKAQELGFEEAVESRSGVDVMDMAALSDGSFDCVVCYGGPLSYVFEGRRQAMSECVRVTRPGGAVLVSVMSLWGTAHAFLPAVLGLPVQANRHIILTGDIARSRLPDQGHYCHMFRGDELRELLAMAGLEVVAMSASNCLSARQGEDLDDLDGDTWDELVRMEIEASRQPGCIDMGTHLIGVGLKPG